jgi:hypothetical protein
VFCGVVQFGATRTAPLVSVSIDPALLDAVVQAFLVCYFAIGGNIADDFVVAQPAIDYFRHFVASAHCHLAE